MMLTCQTLIFLEIIEIIRSTTRYGILEYDLFPKTMLESLPSTKDDEAKVDGGAIHVLVLDDKSLHVQAACITRL